MQSPPTHLEGLFSSLGNNGHCGTAGFLLFIRDDIRTIRARRRGWHRNNLHEQGFLSPREALDRFAQWWNRDKDLRERWNKIAENEWENDNHSLINENRLFLASINNIKKDWVEMNYEYGKLGGQCIIEKMKKIVTKWPLWWLV